MLVLPLPTDQVIFRLSWKPSSAQIGFRFEKGWWWWRRRRWRRRMGRMENTFFLQIRN
jgi:hypothetical protein